MLLQLPKGRCLLPSARGLVEDGWVAFLRPSAQRLPRTSRQILAQGRATCINQHHENVIMRNARSSTSRVTLKEQVYSPPQSRRGENDGTTANLHAFIPAHHTPSGAVSAGFDGQVKPALNNNSAFEKGPAARQCRKQGVRIGHRSEYRTRRPPHDTL